METLEEFIFSDRVEIILHGNDGYDNQEKITGKEAKKIFFNEIMFAIDLDMRD